jgi:hypothetical protein
VTGVFWVDPGRLGIGGGRSGVSWQTMGTAEAVFDACMGLFGRRGSLGGSAIVAGFFQSI